ncbi:MAG: ABC transporter ATP-binding protein [Candidatus Fimadaptatus sp.]
MAYAFTARGLVVGYDGVPLIRDIEITLERGEILTLIGPNGSGKSTILKTITRQLAALGGTVVIGRDELGRMSYRALATRMSVMLTERISPELMTCFDVVASGRYPYTNRFGQLTPDDRRIVEESLDRVRALDLARRPFSRLSDGQRQRVLLARAICQQPEIMVLDEPTSYLDIRHKLELLDILAQMVREEGISVVMSLHEIDLAARVSDRVLCVTGDHAVREGTPDEVFRADTISGLYGLEDGSYNESFGSVELKRPAGEPRTFVLAGGGYGVGLFRRLQRRREPFVAGILARSDVDWAVARQLAARVVELPPFGAVDDEALARARAELDGCERLLLTGAPFAGGNARARELVEYARLTGKRVEDMSSGHEPG